MKIAIGGSTSKQDLLNPDSPILELARLNPDDTFYLIQDTPNYHAIKIRYDKLVPNHNLIFYTDEIIKAVSFSRGDIKSYTIDENGEILQNVKYALEAHRHLANELDGVITIGFINELIVPGFTRNRETQEILDKQNQHQDDFYINWLIHQYPELPFLIYTGYCEGHYNFNYGGRYPDLVINTFNWPNTISIKAPKYEYPNGSVSQAYAWYFADVKEGSVKTIMDEFKSILNPNNKRNYTKWPKPKLTAIEGPKLAGKTTWLTHDIQNQNYKQGEYLMIHSDLDIPNDYKMFSDNLELNFNNMIKIEKADKKGEKMDYIKTNYNKIMTNKDIYYLIYERKKPLKQIYLDRTFISEFVYDYLFNIVKFGIFNTREANFSQLEHGLSEKYKIDLEQILLLVEQTHLEDVDFKLVIKNIPLQIAEERIKDYQANQHEINKEHNFTTSEVTEYIPSVKVINYIQLQLKDDDNVINLIH